MTPHVSEAQFEVEIEAALTGTASPSGGAVRERPPVWGDVQPGGYERRSPEQYDRELCLIPEDLVAFVQATQIAKWTKLKKLLGENARDEFVRRIARDVAKRGTLHAFRKGLKVSGIRFDLAYFRPSTGLNPEQQQRYEGNIFGVVRQLKYSTANENSLDLGIFLNGLPIFTAELKTQLTQQNCTHAKRQYMKDRDPREPLFKSGRCLAHFALDTDEVYFTTKLAWGKTRFFPFNQGWMGGRGNPPVQEGYATAYLWAEVWAKDSVLNLIQHFIHEVPVEDGRKGETVVIFPRYHQLDAVRRLVTVSEGEGPGHRYLIQHSAGSGKSNSIAWLAHQLSVLHDAKDERVFDSVVVITDRRVLDRQLQNTIRQFEATRGVVATIRDGSAELKKALESGTNIIVSTLQKFPYITDEIGKIPGKSFAVIIDEAHSSQSGEMTKSLKQVLAVDSLEEAEREDELEDIEDQLIAEMKARGRQPNVSTYAFTATPKNKTLELFGTQRPDGKFEPFSLYSMRQAIEEGFILDVLENYTTYQTYWKLLKQTEDDPAYDKKRTARMLAAFASLHEQTIRKKVEIMAEHFHEKVQARIKGKAKAMIVTRSRLHAVRYALALRGYLKEQDYDYGVLVAFSGTVRDPDSGIEYTESQMNGVPETQTKQAFERPENRFLVVANKFQTGFDQPLLHTMYVDKKLGGVNAVQTLSRLNRTHPEKQTTMVLDFENEADAILASFRDYYERTLLSEATDPAILNDLEHRLEEFHVFDDDDLDAFAKAYFKGVEHQSELYIMLRPVKERVEALPDEEQNTFRGTLKEFTRSYSFLSQILPYQDAELERLYIFSRYLERYIRPESERAFIDLDGKVDLTAVGVKKTGEVAAIGNGGGELKPPSEKGVSPKPDEELERLSAIIKELNDRYGAGLTE
ncbi:MAG: DEAD/DEAH box helicase family protein, partial [Longimicrobiales bacterium]